MDILTLSQGAGCSMTHIQYSRSTEAEMSKEQIALGTVHIFPLGCDSDTDVLKANALELSGPSFPGLKGGQGRQQRRNGVSSSHQNFRHPTVATSLWIGVATTGQDGPGAILRFAFNFNCPQHIILDNKAGKGGGKMKSDPLFYQPGVQVLSKLLALHTLGINSAQIIYDGIYAHAPQNLAENGAVQFGQCRVKKTGSVETSK